MATATHFEQAEIHDIRVIQGGTSGIVVEESSSGSLTKFIYEQDRHIHRIVIPLVAQATAAHALGCSVSGLSIALDAFFAKEGNYLSDLMDLLDEHAVDYTYISHISDEAVFRPAKAS